MEWCVCLVIVIPCRVALMEVFRICFMELDEPVEKGVKGPMSGKSAALPWPRSINRFILIF